jgi:NADPH2:quinone reductase
MRALYCREFGPEADMKVEDIDTPMLPPGHVLIDIKAAGLNFPDLLCVRGDYQFKPPLPFVPGGEGSGVVTKLADDVKGLAVGDRVCFNGLTGAFGEQVATPEGAALKIPDAMTFEHAAGFTVVYATSYYALKQRAKLQAGETLLVLGAAGGVGLAAVELGKAMGAKVIAAASSAEKLEAARAHGADEVINYTTEDLKARVKELTGKKGADVIYDPVGGDMTEAAFRAIAWEGRHLIIGFAAGPIPKLPVNLALLKGASAVGVFWGAWAMRDPEAHYQNMDELFAFYENGTIKPHVAATYKLDEFLDGFAQLSGRKAIGKVVLTTE